LEYGYYNKAGEKMDNMNMENISTADCGILDTVINKNCIKILFDKIYNLKTKSYMKNVNIIVKNWKTIKNIKYVSKEPFDKNFEKITTNEYKEHEIIQEVENKNELIIFKGFSKEDGYWMENIFEECIIEIK
jgi:hypothetical protein